MLSVFVSGCWLCVHVNINALKCYVSCDISIYVCMYIVVYSSYCMICIIMQFCALLTLKEKRNLWPFNVCTCLSYEYCILCFAVSIRWFCDPLVDNPWNALYSIVYRGRQWTARMLLETFQVLLWMRRD